MTHGNEFDGTLIAVEGLDGAGKSTAVEGVEHFAEDQDIGLLTTHEPTDMWTGDRVYDALQRDTDAATDFLLFCADRREHIEKRVEPALEDGKVVVSDRYADSTRAYQTHRVADSFDVEYDEARRYIDDMMEPWSIEPDLTIYINVDVDTALERCDREDKFETRKNLETVREAYLDMYNHCDPDCRIIDGTMSQSYVRHQALNAVKAITHDESDSDSRNGADGGGRTYADAVRGQSSEEESSQ